MPKATRKPIDSSGSQAKRPRAPRGYEEDPGWQVILSAWNTSANIESKLDDVGIVDAALKDRKFAETGCGAQHLVLCAISILSRARTRFSYAAMKSNRTDLCAYRTKPEDRQLGGLRKIIDLAPIAAALIIARSAKKKLGDRIRAFQHVVSKVTSDIRSTINGRPPSQIKRASTAPDGIDGSVAARRAKRLRKPPALSRNAAPKRPLAQLNLVVVMLCRPILLRGRPCLDHHISSSPRRCFGAFSDDFYTHFGSCRSSTGEE